MTTRPTRIAQTSKEAQREYKKHGPRIPERQMRQLERGLELDQRAARLRELDERKRTAKKRREEKLRKEEAARKQLGVTLATQMVGYSHTQAKLKSGMEAFLGLRRKRAEEEDRTKEMETRRRLEAIIDEMEKEPWDDDDAMDAAMDDLPLPAPPIDDALLDDDLDDETLLEVHDLIMSDGVEEVTEPPQKNPPSLAPLPAPVTSPSKLLQSSSPSRNSQPKQDGAFMRLHGPINKAIESVLDRLPESLIELLSIDSSLNVERWDPQVSLLHKLNPPGLPPHRLRVKVGCAVTLLRDLNSSSQLSKSSHLRVLRVERERLECLVIDGQLEGTKTILTRVPFPATYRNDIKFPFQRLQFPIRVSTDIPASRVRDTSQSTFKLPSMPGVPKQSNSTFKKPIMPASKSKPTSNVNPVFRPPGIPASSAFRKIQAPVVIDGWDDFLDSATQIARELSSDSIDSSGLNLSAPLPSSPKPPSSDDFDLTLEELAAFEATDSAPSRPGVQRVPAPQMEVSIQDLDFTADDLDDLVLSQSQQKKPLVHVPSQPPGTKTVPKSPVRTTSKQPPQSKPSAPLPRTSMPPPPRPHSLKRKASSPPTKQSPRVQSQPPKKTAHHFSQTRT